MLVLPIKDSRKRSLAAVAASILLATVRPQPPLRKSPRPAPKKHTITAAPSISSAPAAPPVTRHAHATAPRLHELDWLRVIAFGTLIFFHSAMPFTTYDWHIKNAAQYRVFDEFISFFHEFRLPLLFVVSGAGIGFAMRRRAAPAFAGERTRRLLLPLLFGMAVIIPPQVYLERIHNGANPGSFIHFWLGLWTSGPYPEGNLSWHHLWFIAYLWVLSLLLIPVFYALRRPTLLTHFDWAFHRVPWLVLVVPAVPLVLVEVFLRRPGWFNDNALIGDWAGLAFDAVCLALGFLAAHSTAFLDRCARFKWLALVLLALSYGSNLAILFNFQDFPEPWRPTLRVVTRIETATNAWFAIVACLGLARAYLRRPHPLLTRANEAVYPFYIIHLTITVAAAFWVVTWPIPVPLKYLILVLATLVGSLALYEFVIRRFVVTRVLFGMRPTPADRVASPQPRRGSPIS